MRKKQASSAVLVAGGFHAEGLTRRLRDQGISYVRLMPSIQSIPEDTHYRDHMKGDVSWKKYLKPENGRINLYNAFVRGARDKLLAGNPGDFSLPSDQGRLLKSWRDQIIIDLANQNQVEKAGRYTKLIDEAAGGSPAADPREKIRGEWMANIERFAEGLRTLQSRGELTRENLLNLLKPSAINAYLTSPGGELAYGTTMSADPAAVVSKSEIRLETPRSETRTAAAVKTRLQELIDLDLKPGDILKIGSNQYVIKASRIPRVMSNGSLEAGLIEADEINESGKVISTPTMSYGEFLKSIPNGDLEVVKASSTSEYRYKLPMDEEARSVGMKDASAAEQFLFKVLQNNPEIVQDFRSRGISNTGLMSLHHSKDKKGNIIYKLSGKTKGEETRDFEVITTSEGNLVDYRPYGNSEKNNGLDLDLVGNALRAVGGPRKVFEGHAVIRPNGAVLIEDITPADLVEKGIQVVSLTTVDTNGKAVTLKLQIQEGKLRNISSFFSEEQYKDNSSGETFNYFAKQHVSAVFVPVASGVNATETPQPGANKTDFDDVKLEGSPGGSRAKPAETTKIILKEAAESAPVVARTKKDGAEK